MARYRITDELYWPSFIDQRITFHRRILEARYSDKKLYRDLQSKKRIFALLNGHEIFYTCCTVCIKYPFTDQIMYQRFHRVCLNNANIPPNNVELINCGRCHDFDRTHISTKFIPITNVCTNEFYT